MTEYASLAQAHFNTIQSISSFFHYYVLILTASITAGGFLVNFVKNANSDIASILPFLVISFAVIGLVGFFILLYISNLRFDAILYARGVNGIRRYFYSTQGFSPAIEFHIRALPKLIAFPRFFEPKYFLLVAITFGLLDSFAIGLSISSLKSLLNVHHCLALDICFVVWVVFFFVIHIWFYYSLSKHRENEYIRTNWIGIDVDGVLNLHRHQFCLFMRHLFGKRINPSNIVKIPVHDCNQVGVSKEQEREIFHHPEYWIRMPAMNGAAETIERLKNTLGYRIHIITSRPWPNFHLLDRTAKKRYKPMWYFRRIKRITTTWLKEHRIVYDRITIEGDNSIAFSPDVNYQNRFLIASKYRFRLFIEDDLQKAIKLSNICEIVFLIDQPYNQSASIMPSNLIRVKEWKEILHYIRDSL